MQEKQLPRCAARTIDGALSIVNDPDHRNLNRAIRNWIFEILIKSAATVRTRVRSDAPNADGSRNARGVRFRQRGDAWPRPHLILALLKNSGTDLFSVSMKK